MKHKSHQTNHGCVLQVLFLYAVGKDGMEWSKKRKQICELMYEGKKERVNKSS